MAKTTLDHIDTLRSIAEEVGHELPASAAAIALAADHIDDLADKLTATEDERDALAVRLQELERLLEGLSIICDRARLACNLTEGDTVPVLEVSRG